MRIFFSSEVSLIAQNKFRKFPHTSGNRKYTEIFLKLFQQNCCPPRQKLELKLENKENQYSYLPPMLCSCASMSGGSKVHTWILQNKSRLSNTTRTQQKNSGWIFDSKPITAMNRFDFLYKLTLHYNICTLWLCYFITLREMCNKNYQFNQ